MTQMKELRTPDYSDRLDQFANSYALSQLVFAGLKLELFEAIGEGAKTVPELVSALGASPRGVAAFADALAAVNLLEKEDCAYRNSDVSKRYLLKDSPESRRALLLHNADGYERWGRLAETVKSGRPQHAREREEDLQSGRDFALAMADVGRQSADKTGDELAGALPQFKPRRMLDLGGGPGVYAVSFAKRFPELEAVVFDKPAATGVAAELIAKSGVTGRVSVYTGDFFTDDLGVGYDFVLISNVLHMYGPEQCRELVSRASRAMCPGGVLCIKDFLLDEKRTSPVGAGIFAVHMLLSTEQGSCYTFRETAAWLEKAALKVEGPIELTPQSALVIGRKS